MPQSNMCKPRIILIGLIGLLFLPISAQCDYLTANSMTTRGGKAPCCENGIVIQEHCQDGTSLIEKMIDATVNLNNYSATYQMTVYKSSGKVQETGKIYFRKPRLLRIEVASGPKKGSVALLASDGKIHGHLGGLLKFFQGNVPANSSMARAINGFPMAGTDFYSLVDYLRNMLKEGNESKQTDEPLQTLPTNSLNYVLDMYLVEKNTKKPLLLKRIFVDPNTYLPVFWQDYTEGKLWSESGWRDVRRNLNLADSLFKP